MFGDEMATRTHGGCQRLHFSEVETLQLLTFKQFSE